MKKKIITLTLVMVLLVHSIGMFTYGAGPETDVVVSTSDLKEQYKYKTNEKQIVDRALEQTDGKKAAEQINNLEGEAFDEGVSDILDAYYDKEGNADKKLAAFESAIDKEADSILKDYAEAAEERSRASELDYMPYSIIVEFDSSTDDNIIYKIINAVSDGGQIITGMYGIDEELPDDKKEQIKDVYEEMKTKIVSVKVGKNQTTEECIREYESMNIVKSVSRNDIQEVSSPSSGKVKIKWSSVYNEEDMLIYRSTSKDGTYSRVGKVEVSKPGVKSFTDSGLESGAVYYYKIRCRSAYGDSFNYGIYSNKVSAKAS